jgi:RNA polymerase sigma-70 factor (ECF subfamily)
VTPPPPDQSVDAMERGPETAYSAATSSESGSPGIDAEDITSETFLRAFRALKTATYRGCPFPAWLVTIARNLVLECVRSGYRRREVVGGNFAGDEGTQRSAESQVIDREVRTMLWHCVGQLPPAQRFRLDLSVAETAEAMGRPVVAIRQLQYRASRNLGVNWALSHA